MPGGPSPPTSIVPGTRRAPVSSSMSRVATICASIACSGARPFSKRPLASLRRPRTCEVRWMLGPSQLATSMSTRVVPSWTSERSPPMTPAIEVGPSASSMTSIWASRVRTWPSSVVTCSPSSRPAHDEPPAGDAVEVEGVQRAADEQHHVVGDVDDVVDRALPGGHQARLEPRRRRADRHVLEGAGGEARAQVGGLDDDLDALDLARGCRGPPPTAAGRAARRWRRGPRGRRRRPPGSRGGWA